MITVRQNTTLVGVSELRNGIERIIDQIKNNVVIIEKRHKPAAVLMSNSEYEHYEKIIDAAEDIVLGASAHQRYKNSSKSDYIDIKNLL